MTYDEKTQLVAKLATTLICSSDFFSHEDKTIEQGVDFALAIVNKAEEKVYAPRNNTKINLNEEAD